jgi:hypothetical protein
VKRTLNKTSKHKTDAKILTAYYIAYSSPSHCRPLQRSIETMLMTFRFERTSPSFTDVIHDCVRAQNFVCGIGLWVADMLSVGNTTPSYDPRDH